MSRSRIFIVAALAAIFLFRLWYGVHSEFWFEDELQIYLIGLKYYTTGAYPTYGPDVVYTKTQIAGGMQGLLVGTPFHLLAIPEAPYILLNTLSFGALCVFAWYCSRRFTRLPVWFVWMFLLGAAWTMNFGTRIVNPSYVLPFSLLFFIAVFDTLPVFAVPLLSRRLAFFLIGLAITAVMQLHLSWVLFIPYCFASFAWQWYSSTSYKEKLMHFALPLFVGLVLGALPLIPTWLSATYSPTGGTEKNIVFTPENISYAPAIILRFFSFASFEVPYMLGGTTPQRMAVIHEYVWMAVPAGILLVIGFAQVILSLGLFPLKNTSVPEWKRIRLLTGITILMVIASFLFSVKDPASHTFFIVLPVAMLYALAMYSRFADTRWFSHVARIYILLGFLFHCGLGMYRGSHSSLYTNRSLVVRAIDAKDYRILGTRRADQWGYGY